MAVDLYEPMNFSRIEIGLLKSLWRHRIYSEDINITICGIILLKFAINLVSPFLSLSIFKGQWIFSGLADIIMGRFQKKMALNIFLKHA